ncbi:uncharacterized protein [Amphiura filiformis]|uniref:uncharacterized protein isoform X2 n=1 Tax=Amphiura filiformis TaxID=82378 RepID=UPI003B21BE35
MMAWRGSMLAVYMLLFAACMVLHTGAATLRHGRASGEEVEMPNAGIEKIVRRVQETKQRTSSNGKQKIRSEKVIVEQTKVESVTQIVTADADDPQAAAVVNDIGLDVNDEPRPAPRDHQILLDDWAFILIVVACVAVGVLGIAIAFLCWYKIQTTNKAQSEAEYPAYGLTGPSTQVASNMTNGDRKLAQSAQMYHYQHQKQQMIAMEKREKGEVQGNAESDYDSEEENEDGDLTVYECPGLAPTGEMQVKNPLFTEDHQSEASSQPEEKQ